MAVAHRPGALLLEAPAATPQPTARRFSVWNGVRLNPAYRSMADIAAAVLRLMPANADWSPEWLVKAGEGGTWQSAWDPHRLAIGDQVDLASRVAVGRDVGLAVVPYVVVRGRDAWNEAEWRQVALCAQAAGRVVLNLEPGAQYWNGPTEPDALRERYLNPLVMAVEEAAPGAQLELCAIPRRTQVNELGGEATLNRWLAFIDSASWECYGLVSRQLRVDTAMAYLDTWARPGAQFRLPVVQRPEIATWAETRYAAGGLQVWTLDTDV